MIMRSPFATNGQNHSDQRLVFYLLRQDFSDASRRPNAMPCIHVRRSVTPRNLHSILGYPILSDIELARTGKA